MMLKVDLRAYGDRKGQKQCPQVFHHTRGPAQKSKFLASSQIWASNFEHMEEKNEYQNLGFPLSLYKKGESLPIRVIRLS